MVYTLRSFLPAVIAWLLIGKLDLQAADATTLRAELERVYQTWRGAMMTGNVGMWQKSTSRYRQVHTHNMIVSQRQPYPDAIFSVPIMPPDIMKLKMLEVEAVGDTAHLLYFGRIDLGVSEGEVPENLLMLRYIKDPDGWRFDTSRMVNLEGVPDVRASLKEGAKPNFLDDPEFNPPGVAPPVPKVCKKPENMAAFQIEAIGYEVTVKVNDFVYPPVRDVGINQLVIGGLDMGQNSLEMAIKATEVPPGEDRRLELNMMVVTDPKAQPISIYRWNTKSDTPDPIFRATVVVDRSLLRR